MTGSWVQAGIGCDVWSDGWVRDNGKFVISYNALLTVIRNVGRGARGPRGGHLAMVGGVKRKGREPNGKKSGRGFLAWDRNGWRDRKSVV